MRKEGSMSHVPRTLAPHITVESLRKQAKRWLKDIEAGDADASARFRRVFPGAKAPSLREVQQALAREFDRSSWAVLKQELDDRARSHAARVRLFLEKSAIRYMTAPGTAQWNTYEPDRPARGAYAARLLLRHPEIARDSIHTAAATGDVETVRAFLSRDPSVADQRGGPDNWTPLLRLAYTRLPVDAASINAVEIAQLLLDHGASPHASWSDGDNAFTVLTGVIGGGEGNQPAHPQAEALARLLIAYGADPFDNQALYNTSLGPDDTFWLDWLWNESERRGDTGKWREPTRLGLDYLLGNAVPEQPTRAAWLLAHGANANAINRYSKQPIVKHALLAGRQNVVDLLVRHGATEPALQPAEIFCAAVMRGDVEEATRLAREGPRLLHVPDPIYLAAGRNDVRVVMLLLDLGVSPDISAGHNQTPLHTAAAAGAVDVAALLLARGAAIDPVETRYNSTPIGAANFHRRPMVVALLAPHSRDIRGLCFGACTDRLRELMAEDPSLASLPSRGAPPLFALPDEESAAVDVAELLLSFGADARVRNAEGLTPAEAARRRGLEDAAALIADRE
jgi:ankyrin repeat protein